MNDVKVFIKNYEKDGRKTQILNVCVNGVYYNYFVNYSNKKGSVWLSECEKKGVNSNVK